MTSDQWHDEVLYSPGMPDLVGMPLRRLRVGEERKCQRKHIGPIPADFELTKPTMRPPLPGPRFLFLCRNCTAELLYQMASVGIEES